jgi:valyl-tRNA synthetase
VGDFPNRFDPAEAEPRWMERWLESGALRGDPASDREPYVIAIPLPNVTGSLHMGHALNNTMQDVLIRRHRMAGREAEWICGTDHAGIATQAVVEKQLAAQGVQRRDLTREAFLERVWAWKEQSGGEIITQQKRLGCTLDYSRERFTLDDGYAEAVLRVFVALYEKGYIYRDRYMVNWDPGLGSAVSDLEVEDREVTDTLVSIAYPLSDGSGEIVVATVRPETMLGDTAVAVSPEDDRYRALIGRTVTLPLVGRELPIVADEHVDPAFGTGALKVTPAHDPNDFEIARRHNLPEVSVIGEDGRMTALAGERYAGLAPLECRERVLGDLEAAGAIRAREDYVHDVPFSHRSGERIEPLLSLQWFCDMNALAEPAIAAVRDGRVRFTPERFGRVYLDWMENIRPWCVSRQLWWGHQIPVWYRGDEIHVGARAPEGEGWERDPDVLDTWFSSALWPFATQGWPERTPELDRFYPGHVLVTGRDIIFLWVARMVMMGLEFMGDIPFSDVVINPIIQAPDGRRMSKSLGTGIDPLDLVDEHGADAVRFGLLLMASTQDVRFNEQRVLQGRQLATKLWNATRLVVERGGRAGTPAPGSPQALGDRWMCSYLSRTAVEAERLMAEYDFSGFAELIYRTTFDGFCDWYLELLKAGEATPEVAGFVLEQLLALVNPVMPFVTEECWAHLPGTDGMLLTHPLPVAPGAPDPGADREGDALVETVTALRAFRSEQGLKPRERLAVHLDAGADGAIPAAAVAALAHVDWLDAAPAAGRPVPFGLGRLIVDVPDGALDVVAERARLDDAIRNAENELARANRQLANPKFVERAPAELVDAERDKAARFADEVAALREELARLGDG